MLRQVALVIGNAQYQAERAKLINPINDAKLIAARLRLVGFEILGGQAKTNLNRKQFNRAIKDLLRFANGADVVVFYYAGHGVQIKGENFLVPVEANPQTEEDVVATSINASEIVNELSNVNAKLTLLILDACRDNPFSGCRRYRSIGAPDAGLAEMKAQPDMMIWYATEPGKRAHDGTGANGPYALAIARHMTQPNLNLYQCFNRSGDEVFQSTGHSQKPWMAASFLSGEYYFIGSGGKSVFVPYVVRVDQMFVNGILLPYQSFLFGQSYKKVNALLGSSSFSIEAWEDLPQAGEYKSDEVRYFWVYLDKLPAVHCALSNVAVKSSYIDPQSYIVFFFKNQRFFHSSLRFHRSLECNSYDWVQNALLGRNKSLTLNGPSGIVDITFHQTGSYSVLEVSKRGVVGNDQENVWTAAC